jgi:uncharacterized membrane protein YraQ (UPF0718 family)
MTKAVHDFLAVGWSIYVDAGFWVVVSLAAGGILHVFVPQESWKKWLGKTSFSSIALATGIGVVLPICSCGVVPLGLSMYWSGASLAATLAFMVATPIINPAAALMAFGLLGTELALLYCFAGVCIPPCIACASRLLARDLQFSSGLPPHGPLQERAAPPGQNIRQGQPTEPRQGVLPAAPQRPALPRFPGSGGCT